MGIPARVSMGRSFIFLWGCHDGDAMHFPMGALLTSSRISYEHANHVPEEFRWGCQHFFQGHATHFLKECQWRWHSCPWRLAMAMPFVLLSEILVGCKSYPQGIPMGPMGMPP